MGTHPGTRLPIRMEPYLIATDEADSLYGTPGPDVIWGGGGNDIIHSDAGNDIINGGPGKDTLKGGAGADIFQFGHEGWDRHADSDTLIFFERGADKIDLRFFGMGADPAFAGVGEGLTAPGAGWPKHPSVSVRHDVEATIVAVDPSGRGVEAFEIYIVGQYALDRTGILFA